jgi:hypothetical protein
MPPAHSCEENATIGSKVARRLRFCEAFEVLGGNRGAVLTAKARRAGCEAVTARADARAADLAPTVAEMQAAGATSLRAIAEAMNERRTPTAIGEGARDGRRHRRLADHLPEQVPREPTPCQVPPPELADNRPLPLALCSPEATLTLTAPLPATLPRTGIPPEP